MIQSINYYFMTLFICDDIVRNHNRQTVYYSCMMGWKGSLVFGVRNTPIGTRYRLRMRALVQHLYRIKDGNYRSFREPESILRDSRVTRGRSRSSGEKVELRWFEKSDGLGEN